ncbi:uncharacterized protein LOC100902109 [Galendromus occidentalis]|uniref:Uncharacterized protein LOC100902109 n=1 Tax=Galendromus occidentalis TaxID=34638 RepID=A0AAJ6QPC3_9ACAR|nr:uncharacterized protein LOC100902109 [Galendromus occidentalis]
MSSVIPYIFDRGSVRVMSLLVPLGLLQLQVLHPHYATTTPASHFVAQPHYVYHHSPSVYGEHDLGPGHDIAALQIEEGRYTSPRVFFDDDSLDASREIRLEEQLREERLRQLQAPLGPPLREVRRYEKSVEGDLDFSEDKKFKHRRKRRAIDFGDAELRRKSLDSNVSFPCLKRLLPNTIDPSMVGNCLPPIILGPVEKIMRLPLASESIELGADFGAAVPVLARKILK